MLVACIIGTVQHKNNPKASKRKEIIKIGKINEIENKNNRINETESWFFERVSKIDKPIVSLTNKKTNLPASRMKEGKSPDLLTLEE